MIDLAQAMGQRLARHYMDDGVRLYHVQRRAHAVAKWKAALLKLRAPEDRFITMGYLAQAHCETGDYAQMLAYAMQQIDLANQQHDSYMKAEAYLNLARASERLAEFYKAISYARHSVQNRSMDPRTPGYAYLCTAQAYLGFSQFQLALEHYELAMQVAAATQDKLLELQICVGLGALFSQLRDLTKAVVFLQNALALLRSVALEDVQNKYRAVILCHMAVSLRKAGSLVDARGAAEEALRLSAENGHQPVQARALHALGDIQAELVPVSDPVKSHVTWQMSCKGVRDCPLGEHDAAVLHYEASYGLCRILADRPGQIAVLASMARAAADARRTDRSQCECHALQLNKKCLELARDIGCKLAMLKCHMRLADLYAQLSDDESEDVARKAVTALTQELELFCNFCGQRYGLKDEALQALPCSHLFHQRCLHNHLSSKEDKSCPKCARSRRSQGALETSAATAPHQRQSCSTQTHAGATGAHRCTAGGSGDPAAGGCEASSKDTLEHSYGHATHRSPISRGTKQTGTSPPSSLASARSTTPNPTLKNVFIYEAPSASVSVDGVEVERRDEGQSDGDRTPIASRDKAAAAASLQGEKTKARYSKKKKTPKLINTAAADILAAELAQLASTADTDSGHQLSSRTLSRLHHQQQAQRARQQLHSREASLQSRDTARGRDSSQTRRALAPERDRGPVTLAHQSTSTTLGTQSSVQSSSHAGVESAPAHTRVPSSTRWLGTTNPEMHNEVVALAEQQTVQSESNTTVVLLHDFRERERQPASTSSQSVVSEGSGNTISAPATCCGRAKSTTVTTVAPSAANRAPPPPVFPKPTVIPTVKGKLMTNATPPFSSTNVAKAAENKEANTEQPAAASAKVDKQQSNTDSTSHNPTCELTATEV